MTINDNNLNIGDEVYIISISPHDKSIIKTSKVTEVLEKEVAVEAQFWRVPRHLVFKVNLHNRSLLMQLFDVELPNTR